MKDFILLGNKTAAVNKELWPYVKRGIVKYGYTSPKKFQTPSGEETKKLAGLTRWYTNLPVEKECDLKLTKSYYSDPTKYPKYDGFDAIEVSRVQDTPYDYEGVMGVPVTYLDHLHPDFEILGCTGGEYSKLTNDVLAKQQSVNGKTKSTRIFIKRINHV